MLQDAIAGYEKAINASAYAPPSPGYVDRIRAISESCEHMAATMLNASEAAGLVPGTGGCWEMLAGEERGRR